MEAHFKKMEQLLCIESDEVRMVGIWGPLGIGKTTIARVLYRKLFYMFQMRVFMASSDIQYTRPGFEEYAPKLYLQQQFLSKIINQKNTKISHLGAVRDKLNDKKVLIILDGVNQSYQLDAMAKDTSWFGPGSRIIVTAEDLKLLKAHQIDDIYKVGFPSSDEAIQILCMCAFGQKTPIDGFEELAWKVTGLSGKLPLGLPVMGAYLRGRSKEEWIETLPKLRVSLANDLEKTLKFSYDALDETEKDLFLCIACFLNHAAIEQVEAHLTNMHVSLRYGLSILAEKSLIPNDILGSINMHSLLAQFGRNIVRQQSHNPGKRQFLLDAREICDVLSNDRAGSRNVIGINFNFCSIQKKIHIHERAFERMYNLQFLKFDEGPDILHLPHGLDHISRNLRLLQWPHFPITSLPSAYEPYCLVELCMPYSKLQTLWEGIKPLPDLKWMDLSSSVNLMKLPDLSTATNLQITTRKLAICD